MSEKFKYAAGLPGYGINGKDGSAGLMGYSIYLTDLVGADGTNATLTARITANLNLITGDPLVGRTYQTGDTFVDSNGDVYAIDLSTANKYTKTMISFGGEDFLNLTLNAAPYARYGNIGQDQERKLVDVIRGGGPNYYITPTTIYKAAPRYFGQISYNDVDLNGFYHYDVWSSGSSNQKDAVALVRSKDTQYWRFGNMNDTGEARDTNLILDFNKLQKTTNAAQYDIISKFDIDASFLFSPQFDAAPTAFTLSQDGSTVYVNWNNDQILNTTNTINSQLINANLVVYPYSIPTSQVLSYDVLTGSLLEATDKRKYKTNIISRIPSTGNVTINDLDENVQYAAYIEYDINGWVRRTKKRIQSSTFLYIKIKPNASVVDIPAGGASISVSVSSNVNWTITSKPSWVSAIVPSSGTGVTNVMLTVDAQGTNAASRSDVITFSGGGITRYLNISQLTSIDTSIVDTGWVSMDFGSAASTAGPRSIKFRRYGNVVTVNGIFSKNNSTTRGSVIASVPYAIIGGGTSGPKGTSIWFAATEVNTTSESTSINRSLRGYVPAYSSQTNLELIYDVGYQTSTVVINFSYICN